MSAPWPAAAITKNMVAPAKKSTARRPSRSALRQILREAWITKASRTHELNWGMKAHGLTMPIAADTVSPRSETCRTSVILRKWTFGVSQKARSIVSIRKPPALIASQRLQVPRRNQRNQMSETNAKARGTWTHRSADPNCSGVCALTISHSNGVIAATDKAAIQNKRWVRRTGSFSHTNMWTKASVTQATAVTKNRLVTKCNEFLTSPSSAYER